MRLLCLALFSLCFGQVTFAETAPRTVHKPLPLPFAVFDHLYLDTSNSTFIGLGEPIEPNKVLEPSSQRGFSFQTLSDGNTKLHHTEVLPGTTIFLFEMPATMSYCKHFFHLLEHIVGVWSFYGNEHYDDVNLIVLASSGNKKEDTNWPGPNAINAHLLKALFPNAKVQTWEAFLEDHPQQILQLEHAVTSDRGLTKHSEACQKINKHLGAALPALSAVALNNLSLKVNEYAKTYYAHLDKTVVTFIKRPMPRTLEPKLEEKLLKAIASIPGVILNVVDFATISFNEQINIIGNTDILISVHGNGLSHILFLPEKAAAVEMFPAEALSLDYMLFANARNLDFLEVTPDRGVITKEAAYSAGHFGNHNKTIHTLDYQPILEFIKNHKK